MDYAKDKNPACKDGLTLLHLAAKNGNLEIFKLVWNLTQDKNPASGNKNTPLHVAAERGHYNIVEFLATRLNGK